MFKSKCDDFQILEVPWRKGSTNASPYLTLGLSHSSIHESLRLEVQ